MGTVIFDISYDPRISLALLTVQWKKESKKIKDKQYPFILKFQFELGNYLRIATEI